MNYTHSLLIMHFLSTVWMLAVIIFVQLLHYPSFLFVEPHKYKRFFQFHQNRISIIVVPPMLVELCSLILLNHHFHFSKLLLLISLLLLILIWLSTFLIQVPQHQLLIKNPSLALINLLIRFNWIRTFLWTLKSVIIFIFCYLYFLNLN